MMTSPAHTCDIDDELALTLEGMNRHGIRRIPVLEDGHPIGLLVLDDILHHVSGELVEISYEARSRRDHPTSQEAPPGANQREHLLKDLDERLDELRAKLREANWHAREAFLGELDDVKSRLRQALHMDT